MEQDESTIETGLTCDRVGGPGVESTCRRRRTRTGARRCVFVRVSSSCTTSWNGVDTCHTRTACEFCTCNTSV